MSVRSVNNKQIKKMFKVNIHSRARIKVAGMQFMSFACLGSKYTWFGVSGSISGLKEKHGKRNSDPGSYGARKMDRQLNFADGKS